MRAFFGLPIEGEPRGEIRAWCRGNLLCDGRRVPPENFHITLCFLGHVTPDQLADICDHVDTIQGSAFDLVLDEPGYFAKPRVFWVGPSRVPDALHDLSHQLRHIASRAGLRIDRRPYQPHLTLIRKCRHPAIPTDVAPTIHLPCDRFCLYESRSTDRGVRYLPLATWHLQPGSVELDDVGEIR